MVKTLRKGFLAVVLAVVSLFALASCVLPGTGTQNPTTDPTTEAQTALNEFTANVTFANAEAVTTSFNLPIAGKKGGFNIPISWTSSNEAVIAVVDLMENGAPSAYYKQAKVTRPAFDQEDATVTLTADFSLTYTKNDGTSATLKAQKTYTFVVVKETSEIASGNLAAIKAAAGKFYFEENGVAAGSSSPKELAFPVEFDATVTAVLGADGAGQFTVSDGSAGIYVYSNKTAVKVGDKVHVKGDITVYYGTLQVGANIEVTVLGASDQTIEFKPATPGEINAMPTADGMYGGQTIKATGTLLFGKYNGGSSDSFWLEDVQTGSQIELYYKSFTAAEKEALQAFAGKFVEIDVVTYDTYASSKPNDHRVFAIPSTCKEATAPEVSDADKLAAAVNKVKAVQLASLYVDGQEFAFPAVDGGEGVTITWAMDPATLLVDGKLVIAEAGTAKLIATVKVGELSETVELTINLAKEAKEEPAVTNKTVAELIALTTEMDAKYTVSGKVVKWGNKLDSTDTAATMYGNFILEDAEGKQIIVYGATATASALTFDVTTGKYTYKNAKDFLTDALTKDIAVGDTVKLTVVRTSYNGNPQLNAIVVSVTKPGETELPTEGVVTLAQAIEIANKQAHNTYTTGKFTVTGKVSDLYNTVYGNMHLLDDAGNDLTIYGLYIEGSKYGDYTGTKPVEGDVITVTGILGTYNGTPQMKNADLVIETKPEEPETPKHEHVACPTCGKCTAADCDGAAEDKCAGHSSTPEAPSENKTVSVVIKDYAAANSWANGTMYNTLVMDSNVTVTMAATGGSGSYAANTGKYYTSGFEWRAYQSDKEATIVVAAAEGLNIATVKITYVTKNGGILVCNGANVESAAVVTVNAASATFTIANTGTATNGQIKVTAIEVVYGAGSGSAPEQPEEPETPKHEHVACPTCGKCTAEDCDGAAEDKCAGHTVEPEQPELPTEGVVTLAQAIEIAKKQAHNTYTTGKFTVTGKVSDLYNTVYGNMHLLDDAGNDLTIYGLYIEGSKYGDYTGTKPVVGDVITVTGILGTYNGTPQMKNADLVIETKPEEPETPSHEHTLCETCGKCTAADCDGTDKCAGHEVAPEEPEQPATSSLELTAAKLGLGAYADGTKTVDGVDFGFIELGDFGNGIQMRNKTKASSLWNATALPKAIKNIVLVYNSAKSTYDNADAFTFLFGTDATVSAGTVKLSTVKGQATYTVTPDAETYTFFKMTLNLTYSFYWDSITINYVDGTSEPVIPDTPHTHTEEKVPGKEATCTEKGLTEGKKCSECGEVLVAQEEIAEKGHTEEKVPGKEATCTEKGLTEGKKCSVCGETLVAQEEIAEKEHNFAEGKCTVCGADDPNYVAPEQPETPEVAGGRADLETMDYRGSGNYTGGTSSYTSLTSTNGWVSNNAALLVGGTTDANPVFKFIGEDNTTKAVTINGKTSAKGTLTSPTLTGGISKITFNYGHAFSDSKGVDINITITEVATGATTVLNLKKAASEVTQKTAYTAEFVLETPVTGEFTIVFSNNSPSASTSNKDRVSLWNIVWEGAAEQEQPEAPKFTTHEAIVAEFLKDLNTFSSQEYTTVAAYWAEGTKTSFWKDDAMHAKWSWIFQYLSVVAKEQGIDTQYIDAVVNRTGQSGYALQNVAIFLLQINNDTWNTEYKETYGGLSSKWTTVDCTAVTFEAYSSYLPAEYFG